MNEEKELLEEETEERVKDGALTSETTDAAETLPAEEPRMFTQEEVNSLVGKVRQEARDRAIKEIMEKYGVTNDIELDEVFGRGQAYDVLNDDYNVQIENLRNALMENALLKSSLGYEYVEESVATRKEVIYENGKRVSEISEPVKTEVGWHLIKVTDAKYFSDTENFSRRYF